MDYQRSHNFFVKNAFERGRLKMNDRYTRLYYLFDKYDASLRQVFAYYSDRSTGSVNHSQAVALPAFIELGASYDVFPTFLSRSELREVPFGQ